MSPSSRLPIDPTTNFPSINTFGGLSNFLRGANADEDSRQLSESMGQLAAQHGEQVHQHRRNGRAQAVQAQRRDDGLDVRGQLATHVEAIVAALRLNRLRTAVAPMLVDLLTVLRGHRNFVVNLGLPWRGLYEYAGYLQALNNFRVLIGQWLLDGGPRSTELMLSAEDFELVAWRTLGEGMLLIDMYEQWISREREVQGEAPASALGSLQEPQVERAIQWWKKLRL